MSEQTCNCPSCKQPLKTLIFNNFTCNVCLNPQCTIEPELTSDDEYIRKIVQVLKKDPINANKIIIPVNCKDCCPDASCYCRQDGNCNAC